MEYYNNPKAFIQYIDHTLLEENLHVDKLVSFYEEYLKHVDNGNTPASFCVYPRDLLRLRAYSYGLINPCVVVNFPYASDSFDKIEEDIKIAADFDAEVDLVFPTKMFLREESNDNTIKLLEFYKEMVNKYKIKTVKMIFETTHFITEEEYLTEKLLSALNMTYEYLHLNTEGVARTLFFKTSTGKVFSNENHSKAVSIFNSFIKNLGEHGGNTGIKISGSVSDHRTILNYLNDITNHDYYLDNSLFRLGASSLLNNLLGQTNSGRGGY